MPGVKLNTPAKHLHESMLEILTEASDDLAVDGRPITIFGHLPEKEFTQKALPVVVVERPTLTEESPWGGDYTHREYAVPVLVADGAGARPGAMQEASERVDLLVEKVKALFALPVNRNLRLAWLHVFWSLATWEEEEVQVTGNNIAIKPLVVAVKMHVRRGGPEAYPPPDEP